METRRLAFVVGFSMLFLSCNIRNMYLDVIRGNYYYGRGLYQSAVVSYLRALDADKHREWVEYNLGNVYHSLGETDAAASMWENASETRDGPLQYHIAFNRGTLNYEMGKYREAYDEFKRALQLRPSNVETKINLELSLRKMGGGAGSLPQIRDQPSRDGKNEDPERILDYVKKKETTRWTATEEMDSADDREDW